MAHARRQRDQRGTSTLEFIIVLPTLLVVLFLIVELSRAWLTLNIVTTAAREGARVGVVTPTPNSAIVAAATDRTLQILASANLSSSGGCTTPCQGVNVTCTTDPCEPNSQVQVDVTVTFETLIPLIQPMLASLTTIGQTAIMRYE